MSDIKLKNVLAWNKSFCILPYLHKMVDTQNKRMICCESNDEIDDIRLNQIQQEMLENKTIPECHSCTKREINKELSPRQRALKDWFKNYPDLVQSVINNPKLYSYDLRYSNLCNLRCQTCNPFDSSAWAKFLNQEDIYKTFEPESVEINPNAKRIYMAGGEPFMIKSFSRSLNQVKNKDCEIIINTNATVITKHMLDALKDFSNVCFILSIDGTNSVIEKIRTGCIWEEIVNNIDILKQELNPSFMVNTVLQKDNIDNIPKLAEWIDSVGIRLWTISVLTAPAQYAYSNYTGIVDWPKSLWTRNCLVNNVQAQSVLKTVYNKLVL